MEIPNLKDNAKEFISNPSNKEDFAESPQKAIISLKNDRGTNYKTYLEVYNELKAAYTELRNESAGKKYGKGFDELSSDQQAEIRLMIPLIISEAEPTNFGEEG
jgi:hypothetical protein